MAIMHNLHSHLLNYIIIFKFPQLPTLCSLSKIYCIPSLKNKNPQQLDNANVDRFEGYYFQTSFNIKVHEMGKFPSQSQLNPKGQQHSHEDSLGI